MCLLCHLYKTTCVIVINNWEIYFFLTLLPFIFWSDMGVERCVNLNGLTEAQIDKKLEDLAKAGESLSAK